MRVDRVGAAFSPRKASEKGGGVSAAFPSLRNGDSIVWLSRPQPSDSSLFLLFLSPRRPNHQQIQLSLVDAATVACWDKCSSFPRPYGLFWTQSPEGSVRAGAACVVLWVGAHPQWKLWPCSGPQSLSELPSAGPMSPLESPRTTSMHVPEGLCTYTPLTWNALVPCPSCRARPSNRVLLTCHLSREALPGHGASHPWLCPCHLMPLRGTVIT